MWPTIAARPAAAVTAPAVEPLDQHDAGRALGDVEQRHQSRRRGRPTRAARWRRRDCRCRCGADRRVPSRRARSSANGIEPMRYASSTSAKTVTETPSATRPAEYRPAPPRIADFETARRGRPRRPRLRCVRRPLADRMDGFPAIVRASGADETAARPAATPAASQAVGYLVVQIDGGAHPGHDVQLQHARRAARRKRTESAESDPEGLDGNVPVIRSAIAAARASATSPMNTSVRCICSGLTSRSCPRVRPRASTAVSVHPRSPHAPASVSSMAMNRRKVSLEFQICRFKISDSAITEVATLVRAILNLNSEI